MDITAVDRVAPTMQTPAIPAELAAQKRDVIKAVATLNSAEAFSADNVLQYVKDPHTKKMVLRVVNRETSEVISQLPPEYILQLADDLKKGPRA